MNEPTFLQRIARRSQNAIPEELAPFTVAQEFLGGLAPDEFHSGLCALREAMISLHENVREGYTSSGSATTCACG